MKPTTINGHHLMTNDKIDKKIIQVFDQWITSTYPDAKHENFNLIMSSSLLPIRNDFVGIYPVRLMSLKFNKPDDNKLFMELIYRVRKNEPGWTLYLSFEDDKILQELLIKAKPVDVQFIENIIVPASARGKTQRSINETSQLINNWSHGFLTDKLCKMLYESSQNGIIEYETIWHKLNEFNGSQLKKLTLDSCIGWLCDQGIIGAIKKNDHFIFALTEHCLLLAESYGVKENLDKLKKLEVAKQVAEQRKQKAIEDQKKADQLYEQRKQKAIKDREKTEIEINRQAQIIFDLEQEINVLQTEIGSMEPKS